MLRARPGLLRHEGREGRRQHCGCVAGSCGPRIASTVAARCCRRAVATGGGFRFRQPSRLSLPPLPPALLAGGQGGLVNRDFLCWRFFVLRPRRGVLVVAAGRLHGAAPRRAAQGPGAGVGCLVVAAGGCELEAARPAAAQPRPWVLVVGALRRKV
jgi:hypothetical protein